VRATIWDRPTRFYHWLQAACVAVCALTGFLLPEPSFRWHFIAGVLLSLGLLFRLIWAESGPGASRWRGFLPAPQAVIAHLRGLAKGRPPAHPPGHNPAGGAMVLALLLTLSLLCLSGFLVWGGFLKQGPLAFLTPFLLGAALKEIHEALAILLMLLVLGHLAGVLLESRLLGRNLIVSMIDGQQELRPGEEPPPPARPHAKQIAVFALLGALLAGYGLSTLPKMGWRPLDFPVAYNKECGACHMAYHPSLLPAASWRQLMTGLDSHFGEDAGLPDSTSQAIMAWLQNNASETWDTQAANRLRELDPAQPLRIEAAPWWKRRHRHIPDTIFDQKMIKSRGNCSACHGDADQGMFTPKRISIPSS